MNSEFDKKAVEMILQKAETKKGGYQPYWTPGVGKPHPAELASDNDKHRWAVKSDLGKFVKKLNRGVDTSDKRSTKWRHKDGSINRREYTDHEIKDRHIEDAGRAAIRPSRNRGLKVDAEIAEEKHKFNIEDRKRKAGANLEKRDWNKKWKRGKDGAWVNRKSGKSPWDHWDTFNKEEDPKSKVPSKEQMKKIKPISSRYAPNFDRSYTNIIYGLGANNSKNNAIQKSPRWFDPAGKATKQEINTQIPEKTRHNIREDIKQHEKDANKIRANSVRNAMKGMEQRKKEKAMFAQKEDIQEIIQKARADSADKARKQRRKYMRERGIPKGDPTGDREQLGRDNDAAKAQWRINYESNPEDVRQGKAGAWTYGGSEDGYPAVVSTPRHTDKPKRNIVYRNRKDGGPVEDKSKPNYNEWLNIRKKNTPEQVNKKFNVQKEDTIQKGQNTKGGFMPSFNDLPIRIGGKDFHPAKIADGMTRQLWRDKSDEFKKETRQLQGGLSPKAYMAKVKKNKKKGSDKMITKEEVQEIILQKAGTRSAESGGQIGESVKRPVPGSFKPGSKEASNALTHAVFGPIGKKKGAKGDKPGSRSGSMQKEEYDEWEAEQRKQNQKDVNKYRAGKVKGAMKKIQPNVSKRLGQETNRNLFGDKGDSPRQLMKEQEPFAAVKEVFSA